MQHHQNVFVMAIMLRIGSPVEGSDFYGRKDELEKALKRIQGDNLMLAAPRRVGKTSFSKKVLSIMEERGWNGLFLDMEGMTDAASFFANIYKELLKQPNVSKSRKALEFIKSHVPDVSLSANIQGVEAKVKLSKRVADEFSRLQESLKAVDEPTLIVLDELTVFLNKLLRTFGKDMVKDFLNQFRAMRQGTGDHCRWIVASSIGVRNFASMYHMSDTLNDFADFPLGAYNDDEARGLVVALAEVEDLKIDETGVAYILDKIGWKIPFFIQLLIAHLPSKTISKAAVDAAYEELLTTSAFESWSERLTNEYGEQERAARKVLEYLCLDADGKERADIWNFVQNEGLTTEQFSSLLMTLENDGYLGKTGSVRYFRSPLLRDFWKRKFCE